MSYYDVPGKIGYPKYNSIQIQPNDHISIAKLYLASTKTSGDR